MSTGTRRTSSYSPKPRKPPAKTNWASIIVALIGSAGVVIAAWLSCDTCKERGRQEGIAELMPTVSYLETQVHDLQACCDTDKETEVMAEDVEEVFGRLEGVFTDREKTPISDLTVSIKNGPQTITDIAGKFVLDNVPAGDQLIVVTLDSGKGDVTQHVHIVENQTTIANIVYDAGAGAIGLLTISAPVDGGILETHKIEDRHRATVYGRCDGLAQILGNYDIWVLISDEKDGFYWVQTPPALIDFNDNTWRANIIFGSEEYPPNDGDRWDIVVVAAEADSKIGQVQNTPRLSALPPHISSNVVTVELQLGP